MRLSPIALHKHFGNLIKVHGQYSFALAPNEQKVFAGWPKTIGKMSKRMLEWSYAYVTGFLAIYVIVDYSKKKYAILSAKHPLDFANEE